MVFLRVGRSRATIVDGPGWRKSGAPAREVQHGSPCEVFVDRSCETVGEAFRFGVRDLAVVARQEALAVAYSVCDARD
jgi:hypothetical protein